MTFKVIYKCQNCKKIFEDSSKFILPYKDELSAQNLFILEDFANKNIVHRCNYPSWGVAIPISFRQVCEED